MYILNTRDFFNFKVDKKTLTNDFLKDRGFSQRFIRRAVRERLIYLNGKNLQKNKKLNINDILSVKILDEEPNALVEHMDLDIIYEDDDLLVVNKPPYMVTHTAKDDVDGTLLNYVLGHFEDISLKRKARFANRLDRDTSGIVIVAKNSHAHANISKQYEDDVIKKYLAIVHGYLDEDEGVIEKPIAKSLDGIRREVNFVNGQYSKTSYKVISRWGGFTLLDVRLFTGRTHQIRVHLKSIGHPIVGDELYGGKSNLIDRQALHCYMMKIKKIRTNEELELYAKKPLDFLFYKGAFLD
ncbi:RluA family pseudouridine synthase [Peptoniphilus sp.]|uniref:RluA family pseudouridine synthase n=1 Tax=Peptoniphilus sp. TaxID=1971214 RepID=UPI003D8B9D88